MATTIPIFTGTPPDRDQKQIPFDQNVQDFIDYLTGSEAADVIPKMNTAVQEVETHTEEAEASAAAALASEQAALASANAALYDNTLTYDEGDIAIDDIDYIPYVCKADGTTGAQPSSSPTLWEPWWTKRPLLSDVTFTVGSGGDFADLNEAFETLGKRFYKTYIEANSPRVTLNILSGFTMTKTLFLVGIDYSWITIEGVDAITYVDRTNLVTYYTGTFNDIPMKTPFVISGCKGPVINQVFDYSNGSDSDRGFYVYGAGSYLSITGGQFPNAPGNVAFVDNYGILSSVGSNQPGSISIQGMSKFFGAVVEGLYVYEGSKAYIQSAGSTSTGSFYATGGSKIVLRNINTSVSGSYAVFAERGSYIDALGVDAPNATDGFKVADGSFIMAKSTTGTLSQTANQVTAEGIIFK